MKLNKFIAIICGTFMLFGVAKAENMKELAHWSAESTTKFEAKKCIKAFGKKECVTLKMPGVKDDDLSVDVDGSVKIDTDTYTYMTMNNTVAFDLFGEKVSLPLNCEVGLQALEVCIDMKDPQASLEEMQEKYKDAKKKSDSCKKSKQEQAAKDDKSSSDSKDEEKAPSCSPSGMSCDISVSVLDKIASVVDKLSGNLEANVCFSISSQISGSKIEGTLKGYAELGATLPSANVKIAGKKFGTGSHKIETHPTLFEEKLSIDF